LGRSIGAGLPSAPLSLECDGEKRKQRVLESVSRLQEYPGHPMILTVSGTAARPLRLKGLVLRVNSI